MKYQHEFMVFNMHRQNENNYKCIHIHTYIHTLTQVAKDYSIIFEHQTNDSKGWYSTEQSSSNLHWNNWTNKS